MIIFCLRVRQFLCVFFIAVFVNIGLNAQMIINNKKPIIENFSIEHKLDKIKDSINSAIQNEKKDSFYHKKDSIIEINKNEFHVVGSIKFELYQIGIGKPISQVAYDELKENVENILYRTEFKKKSKGNIEVNCVIKGFELKDNVTFTDLHEQGLLMYSENIKFNKHTYILFLKKYLRRSNSKTAIKSVKFSKEKGFDNYKYSFDNFLPNKKVNIKTELNKTVPNDNKIDNNSLIIYNNTTSNIFALDKEKTNLIWKYETPNLGRNQRNKFTNYKGVIYVASEIGVQALNANNGEVYWSVLIPHEEAPFELYPNSKKKYKGNNMMFGQYAQVSDDLVFINDGKNIYCLNRYNGELQWTQEYGSYGSRKFIFDNKYVYKSGVFEMFKIDKKSGEVDKILNTLDHVPLYNSQKLINKVLIFGDERGLKVGYDTKKDVILWERKTKKSFKKIKKDFSPTKKKDFFWENTEGNLLFIDVRTGELLNFLNFEEKRDIKISIENTKSIFLYYSSDHIKGSNEDALYIIDKKEQKIKKIIPISASKHPISNFSFYDENTLSYLSEGEINFLDLNTFSFKYQKNDLIKKDVSKSYYSIDYYIQWVKN